MNHAKKFALTMWQLVSKTICTDAAQSFPFVNQHFPFSDDLKTPFYFFDC